MIDSAILGPFGDEGEYCSNLFYRLEVPNPDQCLSIKWYPSITPPNVNPATVLFTSPFGAETFVRVPTTGRYCFSYECEQEV